MLFVCSILRIVRPFSRRLDRPFLAHEQVDAKHVNQDLDKHLPPCQAPVDASSIPEL